MTRPHPSLRRRLSLGVAAMLVPLIALSVASYYSLHSTIASFEASAFAPLDRLERTSHLQNLLLQAVMAPNDWLVHGQSEEGPIFRRTQAQVDAAFVVLLQDTASTGSHRALAVRARERWQLAKPLAETILSTANPIGNLAAADMMEDMDGEVLAAVEALAQLHGLVTQEVTAQVSRAERTRTRMTWIIATALALGLLILALAAYLLARLLLDPLATLSAAVARFDEGDLAYRIPVHSDHELSQLALALNRMAEHLGGARAELETLSIRDGLTGAFNRREFDRRIEDEMQRSQRHNHRLCLLMIDIDKFKHVNDVRGHQVGDDVLRRVAEVVSADIRAIDILARYGGDEFAVVMPETTTQEATFVAHRVRGAIAESSLSARGGWPQAVTISIGLASFPIDASDLDGLIAAADRALYSAKAAGRNCVCTAEEAA